MNTIQLGKSDIKLSAIIMGLWQAGKQYWVDIDETEIQNSIVKAFDNGITSFDTAEEYGSGESERALAKALGSNRKEVQILTKVFANHLKYDQVITSCEKSLKNLKTDYIDLYQIHWPSGSFGTDEVPVEETMRALNDLKKAGKIRSIGVSNFNVEQIKEAQEYGQIESLQPPYSLFWRGAEFSQQSYCHEQSISLLAYSPLSQGLLTGKFALDHKFSKKDNRSKNKLFAQKNRKLVQPALDAFQKLSIDIDIPMPQLALAWIVSHDNNAAIAGARKPEQSISNAKAGQLNLTADIVEQLNAISSPLKEFFNDDSMQWSW